MLVGVLLGVFFGVMLGQCLVDVLFGWGVFVIMVQFLGMGGVVVVIIYMLLIFGEFVFKQIVLCVLEMMVVWVVLLMCIILCIVVLLVWLLDWLGKLVLLFLGQIGSDNCGILDEEIWLVIVEVEMVGVMYCVEIEMIVGVMCIVDRSVCGLMMLCCDIIVVDLFDSYVMVVQKFQEGYCICLLVSDGEENNMVGVVVSVDLIVVDVVSFDLCVLMKIVLIIFEMLDVFEVIMCLCVLLGQMLLVYDEYGYFEGVVMLMDVFEVIIGEFLGFDDDELKLVECDDGLMLVVGWMFVDEFVDWLGVLLDEDCDFFIVVGLVLDLVGVILQVGDVVEWYGWCIEVVDLDGCCIDKLLVVWCG